MVYSFLEKLLGMEDADPFRKVQLLAGAIMFSVLSIAFVIVVFTTFSQGGGVEDSSPLVGSLVILAALLLVAAPIVERRMLARPVPPASAVGPVDQTSRYQKAKTVGFGLRETPAAIGLVVTILTGRPWWGLGLCAAALLAMALGWPRAADLPAGSVEERPSGSIESR